MTIEILLAVSSTAVAIMFGYVAGSFRTSRRFAHRLPDPLVFIEAMGYSIVCVDELWAVLANGKVIGVPCDTLEAAIESVAGWPTAEVSGAGNV